MIPNRYTKEKIYDLLPSIYRSKDKEQGEPLRALLDIIGEQIEFVEKDIDLLYQNLFIESCNEDLVAYVGDLLNAKILNPITRSTSSHRDWVANTISYRRRKGTLPILEQLSRDLTGWNCKAVEFFQNLITTQYVNHLRFKPTGSINMRNKDILELINSPFDGSAHMVDVRHIDSKRGYYNVPNMGIFLWRLQSYPVNNAPAFSLGDGRYTFSQLGFDMPIYNYPQTKRNIDDTTTELNVPTKIRRLELRRQLEIYASTGIFAYEKSLKLVKNVIADEVSGKVIESQILPEDIIVCNLSKWSHRPPLGKVAIDPKCGRILFNKAEKIVDLYVYYYYGFSSEIGGGFYDRELSSLNEQTTMYNTQTDSYNYKIGKKNQETFHSLSDAIKKWKTEDSNRSKDALFEIIDSELYSDDETDADARLNNGNSLEIDIPENVTVIFKSENLQRPVLKLNNPLTIRGKRGSRIIFDGILFVLSDDLSNSSNDQLYDNNNAILKVGRGDLLELIITHCTFVPARKDVENIGRLVFAWENIPHVQEDVTRLKKYLFDILNEKWIKEENVIFTKEGLKSDIITISTPDRADPAPLKLVLNLDSARESSTSNKSTSGTLLIQKLVKTKPLEQNEYQTIYKLPIIKQDNFIKIYSSIYSIGIFGNSIDDAPNEDNSVRGGSGGNHDDDDGNDKNNNSLIMSINQSIIGRIESLSSSSTASVKIVNSIVDGKGEVEAIRCFLTHIENATIFGKITSEILAFASNSIFTDIVNIRRTQQGCLRFCYVPNLSQVPRPFRCILEYQDSKLEVGSSNNDEEKTALKSFMTVNQILWRVKPQFSSVNYGDDGYSQLHKDVDKLIFEGGDNGSEMGAFNHLHNPQRLRNLSSSLGEYLKFGLEAGIFWVT